MKHIPFWFIFAIINMNTDNTQVVIICNTIFFLYWHFQKVSFFNYYRINETIFRTWWQQNKGEIYYSGMESEELEKALENQNLHFVESFCELMPENIYKEYLKQKKIEKGPRWRMWLDLFLKILPYIIILFAIAKAI